MTELIDHTPNSALTVVKRSRVLHRLLKDLWIEDWLFDLTPDGSFLAAPKMAVRLGTKGETIEKARRLLFHLELMKYRKGRGHGHHWFPVLPRECVPAAQEKREDVLNECALALDRHVVAKAQDLPASFFSFRRWVNETRTKPRARPAPESGSDPPTDAGQTSTGERGRPAPEGGVSAPSAGGASSRGGVGGELLSPRSSERALFPPELREGDKNRVSHGGERRAREERGGAPERINVAGAALIERFTPPARVVGAD